MVGLRSKMERGTVTNAGEGHGGVVASDSLGEAGEARCYAAAGVAR